MNNDEAKRIQRATNTANNVTANSKQNKFEKKRSNVVKEESVLEGILPPPPSYQRQHHPANLHSSSQGQDCQNDHRDTNEEGIVKMHNQQNRSNKTMDFQRQQSRPLPAKHQRSISTPDTDAIMTYNYQQEQPQQQQQQQQQQTAARSGNNGGGCGGGDNHGLQQSSSGTTSGRFSQFQHSFHGRTLAPRAGALVPQFQDYPSIPTSVSYTHLTLPPNREV